MCRLWSIYEDTSKFALAYQQKSDCMINLHLVVNISTGHNTNYVRYGKFFFFGDHFQKAIKYMKTRKSGT